MNLHSNICESCRIKPVQKLNQSDEAIELYRLCKECYYRLINYALRPLEFFNLCAIHGHDFYLHDDFYVLDTGEATQPKIKVDHQEKFPFPVLKIIESDVETLVDYAFVQYLTSDEVLELLKMFDKKIILDYISIKVENNGFVNYKAYEIVAKVLGTYAADWIRQQWNNHKENELMIFAPALAACLPDSEGFEIVIKELEQMAGRVLNDNINALLHFESNQTLRWIESSTTRIINISDHWGVLVAASKFDWDTAQKWLQTGRPLSLIALDALIYCTTTGNKVNQPFWLRKNHPSLLGAPDASTIANTLTAYLEKDNVSRTRIAAKQIINNLFSTTLE